MDELKLARQVEEEEENLSLNFLKKIREVNLEKVEFESQLTKARISLSSRSSRSNSFDQHSCTSSMTESVVNSSLMSVSSADEMG